MLCYLAHSFQNVIYPLVHRLACGLVVLKHHLRHVLVGQALCMHLWFLDCLDVQLGIYSATLSHGVDKQNTLPVT